MKTSGTIVLLAGCILGASVGCGQDLSALGDLSMLGDCELPDDYTAIPVTDLATCSKDGSRVMVRHRVVSARGACTTIACIGTECCNCCWGDFTIKQSDDISVTLKDGPNVDIGCEGDDCVMFCYGMESEVDYVVWGTYKCTERAQDNEAVYTRTLTVDGFCKLATSVTPDERYPRAGYCNSFM